MDFAKLKVGTIITYNNEDYFAVPELPKYAINGSSQDSYNSYNARAIAYSLSTGKRLGSKRVEQAEISPNQLSIADQKVFLVKLQLLGYLSKNVEVGAGYDSIRNVTIMQDNVLVKISELGCSATFLKGVGDKVQRLETRRFDDVYCITDVKELKLGNRLVIGEKVNIKDIKFEMPEIKEEKVAEVNYKKILTHLREQYKMLSAAKYLDEKKLGLYMLESMPEAKLRKHINECYSRVLGVKLRTHYYCHGNEFCTKTKRMTSIEKVELMNKFSDEIVSLFHKDSKFKELIARDFPNVKLNNLLSDNTLQNVCIMSILKFSL